MAEIWKTIKDYEGLYEVSTLGRVRSLARIITEHNGKSRPLRERILKSVIAGPGYPMVGLHLGTEQHTKYVHRLVLETFVGPAPKNKLARHLNSNKEDARLSNLDWSTQKENLADRLPLGTANRGDRCGTAKLTKEQVKRMRKMYATGKYSYKDLAPKFGVWRHTVSNIVNRRTWVDFE